RDLPNLPVVRQSAIHETPIVLRLELMWRNARWPSMMWPVQGQTKHKNERFGRVVRTPRPDENKLCISRCTEESGVIDRACSWRGVCCRCCVIRLRGEALCGVAGFTHRSRVLPSAHIRNAVRSLIHRGPDQQGIYESPDVSLGAVRLKILDLAGGDQPMISE